jgi:hypothetical protein
MVWDQVRFVDTKLKPEPEPKLSEVGTGTAINQYGSTTQHNDTPKMIRGTIITKNMSDLLKRR